MDTDTPGVLLHWPGGLVPRFAQAASVSGTLVMANGDINLPNKRDAESPVRLLIEDDFATKICGDGLDGKRVVEDDRPVGA